jgi:acetoin utilization deacetylase AcuC-like enzyme
VFDWDAHAPNGTMGTFYSDPTVLNISIHQDPRAFYPGTGFLEQIGEGAGRGYTINFPVPKGTGDADYIYFMREYVMSRVKKYNPDIIVVAAGQDSHQSDMVSQLNVTDAGFAGMTELLVQLAEDVCHGRLILELEGGYNLATLPKTNQAIFSALLGMKYPGRIEGEVLPSTVELLDTLRDKVRSATIWGQAPEMEHHNNDRACRI